jgi:Ala-tRNA(Pro) deacylase
MSVAENLKKYLEAKEISFSLLTHEYSEGSLNTANAAHIDKAWLAKGVLVRDEDFHYILCVLPSHKKILRHTLNQIFDRHMTLVEEDELSEIFSDCAPGAIPALGEAYGLDVIWDDELMTLSKVFLEAGDHRHLICLKQDQFLKLMQDKLHERFSIERSRLKRSSRQRIAA